MASDVSDGESRDFDRVEIRQDEASQIRNEILIQEFFCVHERMRRQREEASQASAFRGSSRAQWI